MKRRPKVIVIGLDGATLDLIEPWVVEGALPTFRRLLEEGVKARLESTIPPLTPCAWTSFKTGTNPGKHGVYDFYRKDMNHDVRVSTLRSREVESVWKILSDAGRRCCVFNVPFTFPPERVNGILVSGFLTPSLGANFTHPPEFRDALLHEIPDYAIGEAAKFSEKEEDQRAFLDDILRLIDVRRRTVGFLLSREAWDFFMVVFNATDHVQHWYWKFMDPANPEHGPGSPFRGAIFEVYRRMDEVLAEALERAGEDAALFVMSDHGAGPYRGRLYLNNWLREEGYLHLKRTPRTLLKRAMYALRFDPKRMIDIAYRLGLAKLHGRVSFRGKQALFSGVGYSFHDFDWRRTRAYSFGYYGPVFIQTAGERPDGIVPPAAYDALREEIIEKLRALEDPACGERVIDRIWRREEIYEGPHLAEFPDISFSADDFSYTASSFFPFPSNELFSKPLTRKSGEHRLDGVFLARGPGIRRGRTLDGARIIDVAPTILRIFGIDPPDRMDGAVLDDIFE